MKRACFVMGVDAGGTKTSAVVVALAAGSLTPVGVGSSGPGNLRAVGQAAALAALTEATAQALAGAGVENGSLAAVCIAAAGAGREEERAVLRSWAESLAPAIEVTHDADAVLAAGCPNRVGVALISGTGSLAFGRSAEGRTHRAGGWGHLIGDEGSGCAVGREALRAVAKAFDGRGPDTSLTQAVHTHFGVSDATQLVSAVYNAAGQSQPDRESEGSPERTEPPNQRPLTARELAAIAPLVDDQARLGDRVARKILEAAAEELAEAVEAVHRRLNLPAGAPLALAGGVLTGSEVLRSFLEMDLQERRIQPGRIELVREPVLGAATIARDLALGDND